MKGLFDTNLEFPFKDPRWAQFISAERCEISSTTDLDELTAALHQHQADFSYLPCANYFYLRNDPAYRGIASALSGRTRQPSQNSVMVVRVSNPAKRWQDLRNARLGYINTYCTTSYFAPSILLAREGRALNSFFHASPVPPWQGQIDAVLDGTIDVTMVFEDVWLARVDNAVRTRIIARLDGLPTPTMIVRRDADGFALRFKAALMAFAPLGNTSPLYAGFADYQDAAMARFFTALEAIPAISGRTAQSA